MSRNKTITNCKSSVSAVELLKLTTISGRKYLTITMLEGEVMEVTWEGFTPESIFRAGIDSMSDLAAERYPTAIIFNTLNHQGISFESQQYAVLALSEYVKKYFSIVRPEQRFRRIMVVRENTYRDSGATGYFMKLTEARIETVYVDNVEQAYTILNMQACLVHK